MLLGCIADDFTGASDLANTLTRGGMATELYAGTPSIDAGRGCGNFGAPDFYAKALRTLGGK